MGLLWLWLHWLEKCSLSDFAVVKLSFSRRELYLEGFQDLGLEGEGSIKRDYCCGKRTSRLDEIPRKSWPEKNANQIQGIYYRDITLINLVNCKRIKKGTYIIDCIQLNTWRLNSVNESNIIKELINEPNATVNTKYTYK